MRTTSLTRALGKAVTGRLSRLWRREDGTATIEFVFCVPVVLMIFMASMESGFYMIRHVMMERGLDLVMRDFRLGRLAKLDHAGVRDRVCEAAPIIENCESNLKIWTKAINTTTWVLPTEPAYCGNGGDPTMTPPDGSYNAGAANQLMYVRICTLLDPLFPTTKYTMRLRADSSGKYQLATSTVVVVEPH